jgi:SSS family solute:Na+ symporter
MPLTDLLIFIAFTVGTVLFGGSFVRKNKNAADYTSGSGSMPGFVVGMSVFATYVSSISFLALPGNAFAGNWNSLIFSFTIPLAAILAARFFVPFYRNIESASAYSFLEARFGYWARAYAAICYLLTQIARIGSVMFLMALPLHTLLGWSVAGIILFTGIAVILYSMMGGIKAVIWTDAIQGTILIIGALVCAIILWVEIPGGFREFIEKGVEAGKFSLGSFGPELNTSTFWVMMLYGTFINLQNFGIDQNYIQRYKSASNLKSARFSALFGGLLYLPVSFLFFIIGSALYVYYQNTPLPEGIANDQVFPYFIVNVLPEGITGLLIAAIFAAGMSTISTSINSSATIIFTDFIYRKHEKANPPPHPMTDSNQLKLLRITSLLIGLAGMGVALAMMSVKSALDAWWSLAGIFSGGMLGLFLLGYLSRRVRSWQAMAGVAAGVLLIGWMSISGQTVLHSYLTTVLGTSTIVVVGAALAFLRKK